MSPFFAAIRVLSVSLFASSVSCSQCLHTAEVRLALTVSAHVWVALCLKAFRTYVSVHLCAVRRGISSHALIHQRTHPRARADVTFSPLVTYPQMLYTNWPSTGNSFEGAFGGYDDVSVLAFPLAASFHIRVSHWSVQVAVAS